MTRIPQLQEKFEGLRCCVIIPTYNNEHALEEVLKGVLEYTTDVIVVNDGSTDSTAIILSRYPDVETITIPVNTGKGWALRQGFRHAAGRGFRYAITIDSDGQHFPEDLHLFLETAEAHPDSIILGARDMTQDEVPGTSSFGHRFSIFWFKVETGITVADVQTGYRLYPLEYVSRIRPVFSKKYEYEVEIMVRLAWLGVEVLSVPVKVYYAPKETRVSHFRKFRDFTRVSITNSILVFVALLWARPVAFLRSVRKKSVREFFTEYVINSKDSNATLAKSVALGLFMGVTPIWGWQIVTTLALSHLLKLNKFIAVTASNISLPPLLPLILFASYFLGGVILGGTGPATVQSMEFSAITGNLIQYLVGSIALGAALALFSGPLTYILLSIFRKQNG